jgi:hypothetical protein
MKQRQSLFQGVSRIAPSPLTGEGRGEGEALGETRGRACVQDPLTTPYGTLSLNGRGVFGPARI